MSVLKNGKYLGIHLNFMRKSSGQFILMYYMVFSSYPKAFDEAAAIDGANRFKIFYKIALPMGKSTSILTILFSVIWYWNEGVHFLDLCNVYGVRYV